MPVLRIDAHQHCWQLSRGDYHWLTPDLKEIYRDFLPADLRPLLAGAGVSKTVLVQAAASEEETAFMLRLADETDFIAGVVGWIDMEQPTAVETLVRLGRHPAFKGIRPMIQDIADTQWMLKPELEPVFLALIELGLTFDALVKPQHLEVLCLLLERYPDLKAVIDHGAKPDIATGSKTNWFENIGRIAAETQAYCKLSGLITEVEEGAAMDCLLPYMEHLRDCFGADRLMWGSDWPVVTTAASYDAWVSASERFIARFDKTEQAAIWGKTAAAFYGLEAGLKPGPVEFE
ncbi:amidohydrolase family protein [Microbulbifer sp. 2201CG32-9]|uniref:amidohydrolase family protein n=1 Tax=Microbulbifer sp. 2201CG32-9 TaxID=3232309 RepID=UPI00345BD11B